MKNIAIQLLAIAIALPAFAGEKHSHEAGPNGGKILEIEPRAELFVTGERKVQIAFLDKEGKVVAPAEQIVTVTTGERSNPVKLAFEKNGDVLISDKALPQGNDLPTVVQIKATPDSKTTVEKFNLNLNKCPTCKYAEYACICGH